MAVDNQAEQSFTVNYKNIMTNNGNIQGLDDFPIVGSYCSM